MELSLDLNLIKSGETIAVALSGGMDSVALLHAMKQLAATEKFTLKAINVEHGIRGEESERDTLFANKLCKDWGIEIKCFSVDVPVFCKREGIGIEQGARLLRYLCFEKAISSGFCQKIATAHHQSDLVETVLFNLFRGSGLSGVKGISKTGYSGAIIHPMLEIEKEEIRQYVDYHHLPFVVDSTNYNTDFARNFIRNRIVPVIKEKFPDVENSIARFAVSAEEDDAYLYAQAAVTLKKSENKASIPINLDRPVFARASILAMKHCGITKDYTKKHIDDLYSLKNNSSGREITLLGGVRAVREYDKIVFIKKSPEPMTPKLFSTGVFGTPLYEVKIQKSSDVEFKKKQKLPYSAINNESRLFSTLFIDADKIDRGCVLRPPYEGDEFKKINGGTKSLKKFLVDKKVSKTERKDLIVLAKGKNVLAVCGIEISELVKITDQTKKIIKITAIKRG